jgi:aminoglycoside phosphotransferase (APT) family kinase protein
MPAEVDAQALVHQVNARIGANLSVLEVASHGDTGGAVYVVWPDGHQSVVTPSEVSLEELKRASEVLNLARDQGLPVPRYEAVVPVGDGAAVVQERLPGAVRALNVANLEAMVEVNERFAGLLAERPEVPVPKLLLRHEKGEGALGSYSDRSRSLLERVRRLGDWEMQGNDLVHGDFNHENVLFDDHGAVTGVVDWNGAVSRGDRRFALVKLRFLSAWTRADPAVLLHLDRLLEEMIEPETLLMYWAHWSLRMVDWTIQNGWPNAVELHLDVAETRLS